MRDRSLKEVRRILSAAGREQAETPDFPLYSFDFVDGSAELEALRAALRDLGIEWSEQFDHRYTDREILQAPLVLPILRRAPQGDPRFLDFDVSVACPRCGAGARQVGPIRFKGYEIRAKGGAFPMANGYWLFSETVVESLARFSGIELRQAEDLRSRQLLPWFQAIATHELPPMHPDSTGFTGFGCPRCARGGYFHRSEEPPMIVYDGAAVDVAGVPDVSATFEHLGWSRPEDLFFAQPSLIFKSRVVKALREAKVRLLQFYPVTVR